MSRLLEILGTAMSVSVPSLLEHWLEVTQESKKDRQNEQLDQLNIIIQLLREGDFKAADKKIQIYIFDHPDCVGGQIAAAALYLHQNDLDKAVAELNKVYQRQPNNTMALYALGHCNERSGNEAKAVEFYQDCLKFKNYLQPPRQRLAAIYFKNGQLEKTISEYKQLQKEYPEDVSVLVTLGYLQIANGKYDAAKETFNTAILVHPDNFDNENDQVDRLIEAGQLYQAMEQIEKMLAKQPQNAELLLKRADILRFEDDIEDACLEYERIISNFPNFLEAHIKFGTLLLQMQNEKAAAKQFNKAAEINDQIVEAYIGLALSQKMAGEFKQCCATLSLAAAIQPNSCLLFTEAAKIKLKTEMQELNIYEDKEYSTDLVENLIQIHRKQIAVEPENPDLHYRLGVIMMNVERHSQAVKCFEKALEINPTFTRAKSKLIVSYLENAQAENALDILQNENCSDGGTLKLYYEVALLYCDREKFASSLVSLEKYVQNNSYAQATVNISLVLQNLGLLDRATAIWDNLSETTIGAMNSDQPFWPEEF